MPAKQITIRYSPFLFLKRLTFIEFFFALVPFTAALLFDWYVGDITESYQILPFANSVSFNLFLILFATSVQILIIAIAFVSWFFPVYVVDREQLIYKRGGLISDRKLLDTPFVDRVVVKQGRLARNLNYGTLHITVSGAAEQVRLKDIADPFNRAEDITGLANPGLVPHEGPASLSAAELVAAGEHQFVEYKSSLVWDYYQKKANKGLNQPVMKSLVAFMNSSGGFLLIGVDDEGKVLGLEPDLQTLRKPTVDAFETAFNAAFNKMIGVEFRQFVDVAFPELDEKPICVLRVRPSTHPAFLLDQGNEKFYIRAGNASQSLTISQANRYIQRRFAS